MKLWYLIRDGRHMLMQSTSRPTGEAYELPWGHPWIEVYDVYEDEDGTKTILINECKLMTKIDEKRGEAYREGTWDLKIDLNL